MGWWPSRICVALNLVIMLGYGMIDCVIGGQILSAVADNNMSVVVGVIIVAVQCSPFWRQRPQADRIFQIITYVITVIGLPLFHIYERYAWIPQAIILFILIGSAGPYFDMSFATGGNSATIAGDRLSFISLCLSAVSAWAPAGADYVCYPFFLLGDQVLISSTVCILSREHKKATHVSLNLRWGSCQQHLYHAARGRHGYRYCQQP